MMKLYNMTLIDKNWQELNIGDKVQVKWCVGPYGETRTREGTLEEIDQYGGIRLKLAENTVPYNEYFKGFHSRTCNPGDIVYISVGWGKHPTDVEKLVAYHEHKDFEHGHTTYIQKVA